jgi:hypothetical protein
MKGKLLLALGFLITIALPIFPARAAADTINPFGKVIISEVKLGGDSYSQGTGQPKDPQEFITLFNPSDADIDLGSWVIEYAKTSFDKTYCSDSSWIAHNSNSSVSQTSLSGTLKAGQISTPVVRSLTDNTAGSLHLVDMSDLSNPTIEDLLGWGEGAPCFDTSPVSTPSNGKSIKRYLDCNNRPIDTNDNSQDFATNQPPSPGTIAFPYQSTCQQESTVQSDQDTQQSPVACEGVIISEILPNPAGTDTDNEFIEVYNPTAASVPLQGCSLQTTGSSKVFNFSDTSLQAGEYRTFYSSETGLTLPNAAGGTVWLLSPSTELQAISYENDLDDDVSWALIGGVWQATYELTPSAANILVALKPCAEGEERNPDTGYCHSIAILTTSNLSACPEGQQRNPATNRCRAVTTASAGLTPCKEGQERNPATNRCISGAAANSSLTPCKPGQERNPETNRCKAIASTASAALKPCPAGQQRNPSTNRCRKETSGANAALANVKDAATGSLASSPHWWLAGIAAISATSYGVYEWRQEVWQFLRKLKNNLPKI